MEIAICNYNGDGGGGGGGGEVAILVHVNWYYIATWVTLIGNFFIYFWESELGIVHTWTNTIFFSFRIKGKNVSQIFTK